MRSTDSLNLCDSICRKANIKPKDLDFEKVKVFFWYARHDLNVRPTESESVTLSS